MTIIVRRPAPPLAGLVTGIVYQAGDQPRTLVQKILPDAEPSLWVNLNRDEFRSLGGPGPSRVPGAMLAGPRGRALVTEFEAGRAHIWVSFALGAAPAFFPVPRPARLMNWCRWLSCGAGAAAACGTGCCPPRPRGTCCG